MRTNKFLNYFNLTVGIILLWTYIKSARLHYDYIFIIGVILTIWYNWEMLKQLGGQKNKLNRLNYIVGFLTIAFGILLTLASIGYIKEGLNGNNLFVVRGLLEIPLGITTVLLSSRTLKYFKTV